MKKELIKEYREITNNIINNETFKKTKNTPVQASEDCGILVLLREELYRPRGLYSDSVWNRPALPAPGGFAIYSIFINKPS